MDTPSAFEDGIMSLSCGSQVKKNHSSSSSFLLDVRFLAHLCPVFLSLIPLLTRSCSLYFHMSTEFFLNFTYYVDISCTL